MRHIQAILEDYFFFKVGRVYVLFCYNHNYWTMRTQTYTQARQVTNITSINQNRYGSLLIQNSRKDELYLQILAREKEFVTSVPPVNILLNRGFLNIEFLIPGTSKENCTLGNHGLLLWVVVKKPDIHFKKEDSFHWSFIIPDNLNIREATASYGPDGKLIISIPKKMNNA
jgi:HSP20 family molecular chaperone IbpA